MSVNRASLHATILLAIMAMLLTLAACQSLRGVYHTVEEGQTLYRISRVYGVDETYLARINHVSDPHALPVGKQLFIPGAVRVLPVPATALQVVPPPSPPQLAQPAAIGVAKPPAHSKAPGGDRPAAKPPASNDRPMPAKPAIKVSGVPKPAKGLFAWPLDGKVLRCFSDDGKNPCKGIEIAARQGTPVRAAAAGSVIYSGNGIRGYGNLIILKHQDEFFTVYGYNQSNLVKSGAFVSKGEKIALSGTPPAGGAPRLHFEVRYGKQSVDPSFYLP